MADWALAKQLLFKCTKWGRSGGAEGGEATVGWGGGRVQSVGMACLWSMASTGAGVFAGCLHPSATHPTRS